MANFCNYFSRGICRSCSQIELDYSNQLTGKEDRMRVALGLNASQMRNSVSGSLEHFRNRAKLSVTGSMQDPVIGLLGELGENKLLDQGREILDCPVHRPEINEHLHALKEFIKLARIEPYQIAAKQGELKSLILYYSQQTESLYIRFVLRSQEPVSRIRKYLAPFLLKNPRVKNVSVNLQPVPHAILEGPTEINLHGPGFISHDLQGNADSPLLTKLTPRAFVQTNAKVAGKLYQTAADWIRELKIERMLELFCGQGAFSLAAAPFISSGLGIEINQSAVESATETAQSLGLGHLKFLANDAGQVQGSIEQFAPDLILVNPPRRGLGQSIPLLQAGGSPYLIYSSCNLDTLAQDLKALDSYQILRAQVFDLFPHTPHFEILTLLKLKPGSHKIT